jgi:phospholipid transport system substrate-binding protein
MARYFATQARAYKFDRARVFTPSYLEDGDTMVVTQVFLDDGASHRVLWRLSKRGNTYKIVDAKVMGFWLTPFQRTMFNNYIDQQGGNVKALVLALSY